MRVIEKIDRYLSDRLHALAGESSHNLNGQFAFELSDSAKRWVVDFDQNPPVLLEPAEQNLFNRITMSSTDLEQTIRDPLHCFVRAWQGGLRLAGNSARWRQAFSVLFPSHEIGQSREAGLYASIARLIPDTRLEFMNLGFSGGQDANATGATKGVHPWQHCINLLQHILEAVTLDGKDLIDIGCGRGGPSSYLADQHQSVRITGVDYCADSITICREQATADNIKFICASADKLPCEEESFDVVLNVESSHCYPSLDRFYAEVDRVLRHGGTFCYADTFTPESLQKALQGLAGMLNWKQLRSTDISDGVADSLRENRQKMGDLFASMVNLTMGNQALICSLIDSGNTEMENKYRNRELIYQSWQFCK